MAILLVIAGCGGAANGPELDEPGRAAPVAAPDPLRLRLEAPDGVRAGEPVPLRLVLENHGDRAVAVELGGAPIAFDFVVVGPDGSEVWRRLEGMPVEAILQLHTLGPGEALEFLDRWDQLDRRRRRVRPGDYRVRGVLPVVGEPGGWGTEVRLVRVGG